jgi:threonine dehydratase
VIERSDVEAAARRLAGRIRRTPVFELADGVWFKCEYMQHTGTFKARGALNRILAAQESGELDPAAGIVMASGGNAGIANAYAASTVGVPATIFVPESAPPVKVTALREQGATVVLRGSEYAAASEAAADHARRTGALLGHAYDQADVVSGAGTLALELEEQVPDLDMIVVAVGGGGLMAGVAAATSARVVGVESQPCPTLHAALAVGEPVDVAVSGVAADSLGARRIGTIAFDVARRRGVSSLLVSDDDIMAGCRDLWGQYRIVVEPAAAAPWAAWRTGAFTPGGRTVIVLCGANTHPSHLDVDGPPH